MLRSQSLLRLALLLLAVLGVAGMHTLGHFASGAHPGAHAILTQSDIGEYLALPTRAVHGAIASSLKHADLTGPLAGPEGSAPDPTVVCLAVLVAGVVLLVAARRRIERIARPGTAAFGMVVPIVGRGPPAHPGIGLNLSVDAVRRQ